MRKTPLRSPSEITVAVRIILVLILAFLPSCASTEQQCRAGKWYELGLDHGHRGYSRDFAAKYLQNCPPLGVTPDQNELQEGWNAGNRLYCMPESIGEEARVGSLSSFPEVCRWRWEELWPFFAEGRCRYLAFQIPSNEQSLANLRQKFEDTRDKGKKAHIHLLIVGLRGAINGLRAESVELRCGH